MLLSFSLQICKMSTHCHASKVFTIEKLQNLKLEKALDWGEGGELTFLNSSRVLSEFGATAVQLSLDEN